MKSIINKYFENFRTCGKVIESNRTEVEEDNKQVLKEIFFTSIIVFVPLCLISSMIEPERYLYVFFALASLIFLIFLKNLERILKIININITQNSILVIIYCIGIYVGIITNQQNYSVILPVFFSMAPTLFIKKPKNTVGFMLIAYGITVILIFYFKDISLAINDCLNCTTALIVGLILGNTMATSRLLNIQLNKDLVSRENTDFLTKLPNRKKLFEKFKSKTNFYGIIMLDIDDFKKYNDTYGHQKGDQTLVTLASCLMQMEDENLTFLRYGGEEFVGVYYGTSKNEITKICNEINQNIQKLNITHHLSQSGCVTVSVGYYFSEKAIESEVAIHYADIALYAAKSKGKNISVSYNESMEKV